MNIRYLIIYLYFKRFSIRSFALIIIKQFWKNYLVKISTSCKRGNIMIALWRVVGNRDSITFIGYGFTVSDGKISKLPHRFKKLIKISRSPGTHFCELIKRI